MIESKFLGRDIIKKPACPFCSALIESPSELSTRRPGEMPVGACSCGAVYACDETGHNQGTAMVEALVFACNMDWDLAWGLLPEEDYHQKIVEDYDYVSHLIVPGGFYEGRRVAGVLFFVVLHKDVQEITNDGVRKNLDKVQALRRKPRPMVRGKSTLSKKEIEDHVRAFRIDPVLGLAGKDRKLIPYLQRLLYSGDDEFRQRAAEILGKACAIIAEDDPDSVSKLLDGLYISISDTAASDWGAFEAIGEIISHTIDIFAGHLPRLYQFLGDENRRGQVIQSLGKIAKAKPDLLRKHTFHFLPFLKDPDPQVRGYTAWLLGNLGASEALNDIKMLQEDAHEIGFYQKGKLEQKTVGLLASEAIEQLGVS